MSVWSQMVAMDDCLGVPLNRIYFIQSYTFHEQINELTWTSYRNV